MRSGVFKGRGGSEHGAERAAIAIMTRPPRVAAAAVGASVCRVHLFVVQDLLASGHPPFRVTSTLQPPLVRPKLCYGWVFVASTMYGIIAVGLRMGSARQVGHGVRGCSCRASREGQVLENEPLGFFQLRGFAQETSDTSLSKKDFFSVTKIID